MKILYCDIDGVVADLCSEWLRLYNRDYGDILKPVDIVTWDLHKYVKPKCGMRIYEFLNRPGLYNLVRPIRGSKECITRLRAHGWRIVFATTEVRGRWGRKYSWLDKLGYSPTMEDYIEIADKNLLDPSKGILLDDRLQTAMEWPGEAYLLDQPWNRDLGHIFGYYRMWSWENFMEAIDE